MRFPTGEIPQLKALVGPRVPVLQRAFAKNWAEFGSQCWCTSEASILPVEPACVLWVSWARKHPDHRLCQGHVLQRSPSVFQPRRETLLPRSGFPLLFPESVS